MENTNGEGISNADARDHLHIRGEYFGYIKSMLRKIRITSTYVENTKLFLKKWMNQRDHLHIRGEYRLVSLFSLLDSGSPPHTWRIRKMIFGMKHIMRITSTYVENTNYRLQTYFIAWDHLHTRGEY